MGCQEGVADTKTMGGFNKLATRRNLTPADLSSTEHLTVLNKKSSQIKSALHISIGYKNIPVNFGGAPKVPDSGK